MVTGRCVVLKHRLAGGTVNPEGPAKSGKAEAPQSVRPQGAEKVPKQRPQKRGRKNAVKNGKSAQAGIKGRAEATGNRGPAGTLACPSAGSGERHRPSPAMATVGPGSGDVRLRFRMHGDQRAADAGARE